MNWQRATEKDGSISQYAIKRGDQIIAKVYLDGCTLYELWHKDEPARYFESSEDAKAEADKLMGAA